MPATPYRLSAATAVLLTCLWFLWQGATEGITYYFLPARMKVLVKDWDCLAIQLYLHSAPEADPGDQALWHELGPEGQHAVNLILEGRASPSDKRTVQQALEASLSAQTSQTEDTHKREEFEDRLGGWADVGRDRSGLMLAMLLTQPILVLLFLAVLKNHEHVQASDLGLTGPKALASFFKGCLAMIPTLMVIMGVSAAARELSGADRFHPALESLVGGSSITWLVVAVNAVIVAPLVEELLFRGIMLGWLTHFVGAWPGLLISAMCFGVAHASNWPDPIPLTLLGVVLGGLFLKTRSLWSSIALHATFNAAMIGLFVAQGYLQ